jgi:hypothetical protein
MVTAVLPELVVWASSPWYEAVRVFVPGFADLGVYDTEQLADGPLPASVHDPGLTAPAPPVVKVTVPVGVCCALVGGSLTVAVQVVGRLPATVAGAHEMVVTVPWQGVASVVVSVPPAQVTVPVTNVSGAKDPMTTSKLPASSVVNDEGPMPVPSRWSSPMNVVDGGSPLSSTSTPHSCCPSTIGQCSVIVNAGPVAGDVGVAAALAGGASGTTSATTDTTPRQHTCVSRRRRA